MRIQLDMQQYKSLMNKRIRERLRETEGTCERFS